MERRYAPILFCLAAVIAPAQTYSNLVDLGRIDLVDVEGAAVQGVDGNLYLTSSSGGAYGYGAVFNVTPQGTVTTLHSFDNTDGADPFAGLVLSADGNFYGTTQKGGSLDGNDLGTVFVTTSAGDLKRLCSFPMVGTDSSGALVQAPNGTFYGTAAGGYGSIFTVTPRGVLTTLYKFSGPDGSQPYSRLVMAADGNFYGTATAGGANNDGTFFKITPAGELTTLHSFDAGDGSGPTGLLLGADGNFYGVTGEGGAHGAGTLFKMTPGGALTTLYSFCTQTNCTDGNAPETLLQASDGDLYGLTGQGGAYNFGSIFKISAGGTIRTLHSFAQGGESGYYPPTALMQATDGNFYGTTLSTFFRLSVGLAPFLKTLPGYGRAGTSVTILGTDLTGASLVTFNGIPAAYTVNSASFITATVPFGASTGFVKVTTQSGMLKSNVKFQVQR
jgi:uncharacterized repeat protein (TIGR03803 family)